MWPRVPQVRLAGYRQAEALERLHSLVNDGGHHYVCFCEANLCAAASRDSRLVDVLNRASMTLADGVAVRALAALVGRKVPERVPGPSFLLTACESGQERGYRHFFYGGRPGVPEEMAENLTRRFPDIKVAGTYSPPFRRLAPHEERTVKNMIEDARPHLLWVGLGGPKQEFWMAEHVGRIDVPVMLGVGAAFDFHAGSRPWAPRAVRRLGMEWAFRALTGGPRTLLRNLRCVSRMGLLLAQAAAVRCFSVSKSAAGETSAPSNQEGPGKGRPTSGSGSCPEDARPSQDTS